MSAPVEFDLSTYSGALHICFTQSGGGILRQALRAAGFDPKVIATGNDLSLGPINPPDSKLRIAWLQREFDQCDHANDWEWTEKDTADFWSITSATKWERRVVWFSRRSAMEYCGFLEWVRRAEGIAYDVVDVTDTKITFHRKDGSSGERLMETFGMVHPDFFPLTALLQNSRALTIQEHEHYQELWTQLQGENAAFRVVGDFGIKSEPVEFYDELILSCAKPDWQKSARVVGGVFGEQYEIPYHSVGDLPLFGRIRALVAMGLLEGRGDLTKMRQSEVRLKQP